MKYRILGKTGLSVSVLSYGASSLGSVFRKISEADGIRTVHLSIDHGVNFFDVSPYYGLTTAEQVLGRALQGISRDKYYLATKVGRYGDSEFDFSARRVAESVDESLERLELDYIDLIQCHDIEFGDLNQIVEETIPALRKLQESGKVRFVGITGLPLKIFTSVLAQTSIDAILSYCHYALNDTSLTEILPVLKEKQVGIINASPLSMRLLTDRGVPDWHPAPAEVLERCALAAAFCKKQGADLSKLAIQFAVANPDIHTTLVGTATPDHLLKNLKWLEEPVDENLLEEVMRILEPIHNVTWPSGRAENN